MAVSVEAFLAEAYLAGTFAGTSAEVHKLLDAGSVIELRDVALVTLDHLADGTAERAPAGSVATDEILFMAIPPDPDAPLIHHVYYTVKLSLGPYEVLGEMAIFPGFDPGRALTRPASDFIDLQNAEVTIATPSGAIEHTFGLLSVNRFAAERVVCEVDVTFWFPGAEQEPTADEGPQSPPMQRPP